MTQIVGLLPCMWEIWIQCHLLASGLPLTILSIWGMKKWIGTLSIYISAPLPLSLSSASFNLFLSLSVCLSNEEILKSMHIRAFKKLIENLCSEKRCAQIPKLSAPKQMLHFIQNSLLPIVEVVYSVLQNTEWKMCCEWNSKLQTEMQVFIAFSCVLNKNVSKAHKESFLN